MMLANIDHLTAQIEELTAKIEVLCEPYEHQIEQLDAVPGFGIITAQDIIAEIGVDMTVFPTAGHLVLLGPAVPAGRLVRPASARASNATGRGNPYLGGALGEAAVSAGRTQTFLGAKYRRLVRHMPKKKAQGAISRPSWSSPTPCSPTPKPTTPTSAPTTTNSGGTSAARPATTSAASNASATRSPSKPSPQTRTGDLPVTTAS